MDKGNTGMGMLYETASLVNFTVSMVQLSEGAAAAGGVTLPAAGPMEMVAGILAILSEVLISAAKAHHASGSNSPGKA